MGISKKSGFGANGVVFAHFLHSRGSLGPGPTPAGNGTAGGWVDKPIKRWDLLDLYDLIGYNQY